MILSSLRIQWISDDKGYGLFATKPIPKGTITFVQDPLDIVIAPNDPQNQDNRLKGIIDRYSYEGPDGSRIISWDFGKYMNHCCFSNTLTTGYGFEIAIRDIAAGEEVTDDYRIFTTEHHLAMNCEKANCEGSLNILSNESLIARWDRDIVEALSHLYTTNQELWSLVPLSSRIEVENYLKGNERYASVRQQLPPLPDPAVRTNSAV